MLSESFKNRNKRLAGILAEELKLIPDPSGRSDKNTFSWYAEEYLLNLCSVIISSLDHNFSHNGFTVAISQQSTKMQQNTLVTKLTIKSGDLHKNNKDYLLTAMLNFSESANTTITISHDALTQSFNLNTQHSGNDINILIREIITYISNSLKT